MPVARWPNDRHDTRDRLLKTPRSISKAKIRRKYNVGVNSARKSCSLSAATPPRASIITLNFDRDAEQIENSEKTRDSADSPNDGRREPFASEFLEDRDDNMNVHETAALLNV